MIFTLNNNCIKNHNSLIRKRIKIDIKELSVVKRIQIRFDFQKILQLKQMMLSLLH